MKDSPPSAIGGYLELELPRGHGEWYPHAHRYQSARAAFLALLCTWRPKRVWLPWYLCASMVESAVQAGVPVARYAIDEKMRVLDADFCPGDWLVYVNYFGLCDDGVEDAAARFGAQHVVVDNSQAFFSPPANVLATLYSPRKYFGVPDGGYLLTQMPMSEPVERDTDSVQHGLHLLKRLGASAEAGYSDFRVAEARLHGQAPKSMSQLTRRLLAGVDYVGVREARARNFAALHSALGASNHFQAIGRGLAPALCYPYGPVAEGTREALQTKRIYTPCYWPEVVSDPRVPAHEAMLARDFIFLPCDQRLSVQDLARLVAATRSADGRASLNAVGESAPFQALALNDTQRP